MTDTLPRYWYKANEPEAGTYELVMLTSWSIGGDPRNSKVLYVLKSLNGYLNEAFEWSTEAGKVWRMGRSPAAPKAEGSSEPADAGNPSLPDQETIRPYIHKACEELDAAMFSGDAFYDEQHRLALRWYMARWERALQAFDLSEQEREADDDENPWCDDCDQPIGRDGCACPPAPKAEGSSEPADAGT